MGRLGLDASESKTCRLGPDASERNSPFPSSGADISSSILPVRFSFFFFALVAFIFLLPSIHAAPLPWQSAVGAALMINVGVLIILFLAVSVLHLQQLKGLLYDEAGQVVVTILLVALLVGGFSEIGNFTKGIGCGMAVYSCSSGSIHDNTLLNQLPVCTFMPYANGQMYCPSKSTMELAQRINENLIGDNRFPHYLLTGSMESATEFNAKVGAVSSVSAFCNLLGVGLTVAGCSAYGVLRGPVGQLISALGIGLMEVKAQQILLAISNSYALTLLLPLGILLRCLHFTRKAGGTLIAIALSLYFVLPLATMLSQSMADGFIVGYAQHMGKLDSGNYPNVKFDYGSLATGGSVMDAIECDPTDPDETLFIDKVNAFSIPKDYANNAVPSPTGLIESGSSLSERVLFLVIVRTLLMGALTLTITITSIRVLGKLLATEIEVWSIARLS